MWWLHSRNCTLRSPLKALVRLQAESPVAAHPLAPFYAGVPRQVSARHTHRISVMTPSLDATFFLPRLPIGVDHGDPSKYAILSKGVESSYAGSATGTRDLGRAIRPGFSCSPVRVGVRVSKPANLGRWNAKGSCGFSRR